MRQGKGKWVSNTGERYEGEFKEDIICGQGTYFWQDGSFMSGTFNHGKPVMPGNK